MIKTPQELTIWSLETPENPTKIGLLKTSGHPVFNYDDDWIKTGFALSPGLTLKKNSFLGTQDKPLPGALRDAMPDRWGQQMITHLDPGGGTRAVDFLWRGGDRRFGALGVSGDIQNYTPYTSSVVHLNDLDQIGDILDRVETRDFEGLDENTRLLINSSRSMGGAQPKVLLSMDGCEWLAKFSRGGAIDLGVAEHASMQLARQAGITVPETRVINRHGVSVVLIKRFDRKEGARIHAISAKTAMQDERVSGTYVGLAQVLRKHGKKEDLLELFRRLAFNTLIDNTDDHSRNHALLRNGQHWRLAPAYDILPQMNGSDDRGMPVGYGNGTSKELAILHAAHFGMKSEEALVSWDEVAQVVSQWKEVFGQAGMTKGDLICLQPYIQSLQTTSLPVQTKIAPKFL